MRKKLFTFLLALVTSVGLSWATDPIVITTNTEQYSYIQSIVTITCDNKGDGDGFAIGGSSSYTATITNLGSSTISEIVLVPGYYKSNHSYVRANGAAPTTSSNDLITFTDVNSNSVTLSMSTTNNFQIKEVRVTLVGGGSTDQDVADAVIALINAIPNPVEYNATCYDAIALARAIYDNLTDAQKALVSNYSTLTAAEAAYAALAPQPVSGDVLPGAFTINGDGDQINFSKANLQYAGSPATWKFAENQWSIIGAAQADDNRDLFGWGTGDAPNKVSSELSDYADYHEWGENMGEGWYTLSRDEWYYLFKTRDNASTLCGPAVVNGVSGIIILPDDWTLPGGMSFNPSATNFGANGYADEAWETMENAGAVFLPVAGYRYNGNINWVGQSGYYWSSSVASAGASAWCYRLTKDNISREYYNLHYGMCVRLVKAVVKSDQEFADPVIALIEAIGTVEYTQDCKNRIDAARAAYDHLTDAQKALVSNYSTLTNAEATYASLAPTPATDGSLSGAFTINGDGDQINFSKGNLQYVGSWQFAEDQWSIIGNAQADDNRDLFGWGTGDAPNKVSMTLADYAEYHEWGTNMGDGWYTLSRDEWTYLFQSRTNAANLYAPANVNGVNGFVVLPDEWTQPYGTTFTPGVTNYGTNVYADAAWTSMEDAGAVFLPVAGYRYNGNVNWQGQSGYYWSSTVASEGATAWSWLISASNGARRDYYNLYYGMPVRLVKAASSTPVGPSYIDADFAIDFRTDPYTVVGGGALPTGVEVAGDFHDGQHGYSSPVITIPVTAGNYLVKMGTCQFSNADGSVKNEDGTVTYTTLATNTGVCYDANPSKNYVAAIITIPSDQIIKVHGAEYTPFFSIEKMAAVPAFTDFELNFQTNPYNEISGAKPEGTVIAGSFHDNLHGYQNVEATVPVKAGKYRLTLGACEFDSNAGTVMSETNVELASFNQNLGAGKCYHNNTTKNIVSVIFDVDKDQTITIDCGQYTPYMKLEAVTSYAVEFALGDAEGTAPAALDVTVGNELTMPVNKTLYKAGYTLTGWSDGVNTYPIGESFTPANDVVLTPVFTANQADLLNASSDVTVKWYFGGDNGAPTTSYEGTSGLLVAQATIGNKTVDVKLAIDATSGKFAPQPTTEWAQVVSGTIFTYPYKEGMTVNVDNYNPNVTYYIADAEGKVNCVTNDYYSFIEVTYPASAPTPAVEIGDLNNAEEVTAFLNTYDGQTIDELIINRPVLNNMYNTLCLPFHMDADQIANSSLNGVEIYEFIDADVTNDELYLYTSEQKHEIVAGRPYLVKFSAASQLDELNFIDVVINNADLDNQAVTIKGVTFKGTFQPIVLGAQEGLNFNGGHLFLMANNTLMWPNTNNPLKPFRAYFTVNVDAGQSAGMPVRRGMPAHIGGPAQIPTGVDQISQEPGQTCNSQKLIENGVLYIIKNGVKYNAQGQIVK